MARSGAKINPAVASQRGTRRRAEREPRPREQDPRPREQDDLHGVAVVQHVEQGLDVLGVYSDNTIFDLQGLLRERRDSNPRSPA
jgi:hypothetical protein